MVTATNVDATAVNTIAWLSADGLTHRRPGLPAPVPVGHRRLRAAARRHPRRRRLRRRGTCTSSARSSRRRAARGEAAELVLIDGQQRITTLMLLVAALHHTVRDGRPASPPSCERVLVRARRSDAHQAAPAPRLGGGLRERGARPPASPAASCATRGSTTTTRSSAARSAATRRRASGAACRSWSTSRSRSAPDANAQQTFESLNSTGEPLRDHELIHNYVLMGLSHAEQSEIEDDVLGADRAEHRRGDRQLLAALPRDDDRPRGRRSPASAACTTRSGTSSRGSTSRRCGVTPREWRELLGDLPRAAGPGAGAGCRDRAPARRTSTRSARGMYPLVMRAYRDHARGAIDRDDAHRDRSSTCSRCCCAARSSA